MTLGELAGRLGLSCPAGKGEVEIDGLCSLDASAPGRLTYLEGSKFLEALKTTRASAALVHPDHASALPDSCVPVTTEEPHLMLARASAFFAVPMQKKEGAEAVIGEGCSIAANIHLGKDVVIGNNVTLLPGVFIGDDVTVGDGTVIHPNVTVYPRTSIGKECILFAGAVVGCEGFGYAHTKTGEHVRIHHTGTTVLEDRVEIGANSTVDRGVFDETRVGKGTKIDDLCLIAHNVTIGPHCIIVAQAGIAGSTKLGRNVVMAAQSGAADHVELADFTTIAARGGVTKATEPGKTYAGFPLMEAKQWRKLQAKLARMLKGRE